MLVIRLSRKGRRNHPMYRITVAENSMPTDGKFVEIVGHYNPTDKDQPLEVKKERVEYWMSVGAQPSNTVKKLLNRVGFDLPIHERNRKPKKQKEGKPADAEVKPTEGTDAPKASDSKTAVEAKPEKTINDSPADSDVKNSEQEKPSEEVKEDPKPEETEKVENEASAPEAKEEPKEEVKPEEPKEEPKAEEKPVEDKPTENPSVDDSDVKGLGQGSDATGSEQGEKPVDEPTEDKTDESTGDKPAEEPKAEETKPDEPKENKPSE